MLKRIYITEPTFTLGQNAYLFQFIDKSGKCTTSCEKGVHNYNVNQYVDSIITIAKQNNLHLTFKFINEFIYTDTDSRKCRDC